MLVSYGSVWSIARKVGSVEEFTSRHPYWALLISAPIKGVKPEDAPDLMEVLGKRTTRHNRERVKTGPGPETARRLGVWTGLWIAWLRTGKDKKSLTVGRAPASHILIDHPSISAVHLVLSKGSEDKWILVDQDSSFGTTVNDEPAASGGFVEIESGDMIRLSEAVQARLLSPEALYELLLEKA